MAKVSLVIDGQDIVADEETTVLEAALQNDIYIPHLCYHPAMESWSACRLCIVEIDDEKLVTSCRITVKPGMQVKTKSRKVDSIVRPIVELLIANHHITCRGCPGVGSCELQKIMGHLHINRKRVQHLRLPKAEMPMDTSNPYFDYDPNKCLLCGICVQTCQRIQEVSFLYFIDRSYGTKISFYGDESKCESCKECVARCPVGALISKKEDIAYNSNQKSKLKSLP